MRRPVADALWSKVRTTLEPMTTRVGFLFNHEAVHQVAHCATIAYALSRNYPEITVVLFVSSEAQKKELARIASHYPGQKTEIVDIDCSVAAKAADFLLGKIAPIRKLAVLRASLDAFSQVDALVTPEKTSAMIKHRFGLSDLKMIYARHGAGDRALSFNADNAKFDFLLLPGEKFKERLDAAGRLEGCRYRIIGYPKFDLIQGAQGGGDRPKLFDNNRKTVLYNPHFDSHLSSWYKYGDQVLDYFYHSTEYNLIFAPHIMLFKRPLHVSLEERKVRVRKKIAGRYCNCRHMLIDTGSPALVDMSYTMAADIYLGDISSQIYEFIYHPRPCLFLDAHGAAWKGDPNYNLWNLGSVLASPDELGAALASVEETHARDYAARQRKAFAYTYDLRDTPSSDRAATAIVDYLNGVLDQDAA